MTENTTTPAPSEPVAGLVQRPVRPRLLSNEDRRWGLADGYVGHVDRDVGLRAMCDHGAARFHEGYCDLVNFDCMPAEVEQIKNYMAEKHPSVAYSIGSAKAALDRAWRAFLGPNARLSGLGREEQR